MEDSLLRRLRVEQARTLLYDADPHRAVMLACDLLVAGVNGDAVAALAAESARTLPTDDANRHLAAVAALAGHLEDDLGGRADNDLQTRLDALARTILNRLVLH